MKVLDALSLPVTQAEFALMVGLSEARVSQLVSDGVLLQGAVAGAWLEAYCDRLREQAAGRAAAGDLDLAGERARLARAQAEKVEMQNAVTRGELAPVVLIEQVLTNTAARIAGIFDALPGAIRRRVPLLTAGDVDLIAAEVAKARNRVASMSLADLEQPGEDGQAEGGQCSAATDEDAAAPLEPA